MRTYRAGFLKNKNFFCLNTDGDHHARLKKFVKSNDFSHIGHIFADPESSNNSFGKLPNNILFLILPIEASRCSADPKKQIAFETSNNTIAN
jgi:hypothetical protein